VAKKKPLPHLPLLPHLLLKLLLLHLLLHLLLLLLPTLLLLHLLPLLPARRSNFFCFRKMPPPGGFFRLLFSKACVFA
jgi:hypothetical protein